MYCSLDSFDEVTGEGGGQVIVQWDDRTPDQMATTPELSTLYALTRILRARMAGAGFAGCRIGLTELLIIGPSAGFAVCFFLSTTQLSSPAVATTPVARVNVIG